jgi:adenylate cyclase
VAREQRKLAAVIAADVVGYSRLMGRDESGTLARLRKNRSEHLDPVLTKYAGRLVKLTGDGALIEFASAVDALSAAIEFQQAMAEANSDRPTDTALVFRMGLHLGDLIVDGDDLYGDGVNVAARLEGEAPAGGILISRNVRDAVAGRVRATFEDLGGLSLKNIERPVRTFWVHWEASDWRPQAAPEVPVAPTVTLQSSPTPPLSLPDKPSIAVLPFQNMSGDPEQEYFADGVVEDIITALSRFKSLFVIARNSSFTYKGRAVDIKQIGRELGVRYVLEGSVRKTAGKVRITGQLIDAASGGHLWADRYDGPLDDIFDVQDQVTTDVVGAVAPRLDQVEIERAKRKPVENLDAYDCYLRGIGKVHEYTKNSIEGSLKLFYRAIELDPGFATPYGMAAGCYAIRKIQGWIEDKEQEEVEAKRLALLAAEIGPEDSLALSGAAHALSWVCRELETSATLTDQALSINPNSSFGWTVRGFVSMWLGEHESAIEQCKRALRLSPLDPRRYFPQFVMAFSLLLLGRYEEASNCANTALVSRPTSTAALCALIVTYAPTGRVDDAQKLVPRLRLVNPALRIADLKEQWVFKRSQDTARFIEGLRRAGLPE